MWWLLSATSFAVPLELSHQGRVLDVNGSPMFGSHNVEIRLYDGATNPTPTFTETFALDLADGRYHVVLGTQPGNLLDETDLGADAHVEVRLDGSAIGPRQRISSVPYAVQARSVVGGTVSAARIDVNGATVVSATGGVRPGAGTCATNGTDDGTLSWDAPNGRLRVCIGGAWRTLASTLGSASTSPAASCKAVLLVDPNADDGVYWIDPNGGTTNDSFQVHCDMSREDGGWILAFSNANNWASNTASTLPSTTAGGNTIGRWYDATWRVTSTSSPSRLGVAWDGAGALEPNELGAINVKALYDQGFRQVRFEYVQGSTGESQRGWCDTSLSLWSWGPDNTLKNTCKRAAPAGDNRMICRSGYNTICDSSGWNNGWSSDISLGDSSWDYAFQSAPNHNLHPTVPTPDFMVAGWKQTTHANNAQGQDYAVRIWLREP
jgi:hypothetical protein